MLMKLKKKISWDKENNYNINIIYEPFIANEIKAREKHYTQSQVFLQTFKNKNQR